MNNFKKFSKNKKGSELVEKIIMVAFSVAAGGAVIIYGSQVIVNAKNTQITGILGQSGQENYTGPLTQEQINSHFNDSSKTITFSSGELNNRSFPNLKSKLEELVNNGQISEVRNTTIQYGGYTFVSDEITYGVVFLRSDNYDYNICTPGYNEFSAQNINDNKFNYFVDGEHEDTILPFESDFVWNFSTNFYNQIKDSLISDLS